MTIYVLSLLVSFTAVALKGFQHKNVIGDHLSAVFFTSFIMALFDYAAISIVISGDWPVALTAGTGAAFGMIFALKLHDKVFKSSPKKGLKTMFNFTSEFLLWIEKTSKSKKAIEASHAEENALCAIDALHRPLESHMSGYAVPPGFKRHSSSALSALLDSNNTKRVKLENQYDELLLEGETMFKDELEKFKRMQVILETPYIDVTRG